MSGDAREELLGNCTGLITGCLKEEPKVGKGRNLSDIGRNKSGK